jgi:putative aminopeptidase FrvX
MSKIDINLDATIDFLVGLLNTPSPTGYHIEAISYVKEAFEALEMPGLSTTVINKGGLLVKLEGEANDAPVALTAHADTLGFMVKEIKSNGRLKLMNLGGILWGAVESSSVTIRTHDGKLFRGSVAPENTSVHVNRKIASTDRNGETMEVRLDEKTTSVDETRNLGIGIGDFVFVDPAVEVTESGFVRSHFLDDKAGVAVIYGAMLAIKDAGLVPPQDTYVLITNYEEVGHGGAFGLPDDLVELLAVDMGAIGAGQAGDEFSVSICAKDGSGPYDFEMTSKLRRIAAEHDIANKVDIYVYYGSDGSAYWRAGGGARVGLVGPGVDASHAYERTHKDSLLHTTHLIARYILDGSK